MFLYFLVRSERPQHTETRSGRPHSGNDQVSGREAALARPALHTSVPISTALLRFPVEDTKRPVIYSLTAERQLFSLCVYYV